VTDTAGGTANIRVLVADDDEALRGTVTEILRTAGFAVTEACDGDEALQALSSGPVDVVVLDVRMPKRDGISVVEEIDPRPPPPAVLLVSAYMLENDLRERLGDRVVAYLRKPVHPTDLVAAVDDAARHGAH
jgi:CheY-like chemotaxis protein